jgi:rod shape determining protein RodA
VNRLALLLPHGDRRVLVVYSLLLATSLAILWSVTEPLRGPYTPMEADVHKGIFWRQVLWIAVSWCAMVAVARLPLRHVANMAWPAYFGTVLLLVVVLVAAPEVAGARRWLPLGSLRLQPSEFGMLACIVLLASYFSRHANPRSPALTAGTSLALILVPLVLVLREPDLGTSLCYLGIWLGMVFWYGISGLFLLTVGSMAASAIIMFYSESVAAIAWPWGIYLLMLMAVLYLTRLSTVTSVLVLGLNLVSGLGIPLVWDHFEAYQQSRILTFFDPSRDAMGTGYQAIQSRVAIGSGGLFGTHYLQGTQKGLAFLPERHTDFIFSVVGEELGLVGVLLVLAMFLALILQAIQIAVTVRRPFTSLMAVGIASYFAFHIVVNISITTGLMPVTGLPLPLISYGGSNILVSSLMVGLLLNISGRQYDA